MVDKRYASRKFALAVVALVIATALLVGGYITGEQWATFAAWDVGLYMGGNVGAYAANYLTGPRQ